MDRHCTVVVIPAFNEELTISKVVLGCLKYASVIVVDDHSEDKTYDEAKKTGAVIIRNSCNLGYDKTLLRGFDEALKLKFKNLVIMDGDDQHDIKNLPLFLKELSSGKPLVLGIRENIPRISEKFFILFFKLIWGVSDPLCGMKGYNLENLPKNIATYKFSSCGTQPVIGILENNNSFSEIKVLINDRIDNSPRYGGTIKANIKIFKSLILCMYFVIVLRCSKLILGHKSKK
jgi:glycosyltransferase involved in cell wall biosynthesis